MNKQDLEEKRREKEYEEEMKKRENASKKLINEDATLGSFGFDSQYK